MAQYRGRGISRGYPALGVLGVGISRPGVSISIGGGHPYGYNGVGFNNNFAGYGNYPQVSGYRGYSPYINSYGLGYSSYPSLNYGQALSPSYRYQSNCINGNGYRPSYVVSQCWIARRYPTVSGTSELRPGIILHDGSRVTSVGPLGH